MIFKEYQCQRLM